MKLHGRIFFFLFTGLFTDFGHFSQWWVCVIFLSALWGKEQSWRHFSLVQFYYFWYHQNDVLKRHAYGQVNNRGSSTLEAAEVTVKRAFLEICKAELEDIFTPWTKPPTPNHRLRNGFVARTFTFLLRRGNTLNLLFRDGQTHGIVQNTSTRNHRV